MWGTILRTAEAASHIRAGRRVLRYFQPEGAARQHGRGVSARLEQYRAPLRCAAALNERGLRSLAAVPDGAAAPITSIPFEADAGPWIGNEGNGLTQGGNRGLRRAHHDRCAAARVVQASGRGDRSVGNDARRGKGGAGGWMSAYTGSGCRMLSARARKAHAAMRRMGSAEAFFRAASALEQLSFISDKELRR